MTLFLLVLFAMALSVLFMTRREVALRSNYAAIMVPVIMVSLGMAGCGSDSGKNENPATPASVYETLISHYEGRGLDFSGEVTDPKDASLLTTAAEDRASALKVKIQRNSADKSLYLVEVETTVDKNDDLKWAAQQVLPAWKESGSFIDQFAKAGAPSLSFHEADAADIYLLAGGNTSDTKNLATLTIYPAGEKKSP